MADVWHQIPGFLRSPNISGDWRLYEVENRAADPEGTIECAMERIAPWRDKVLIVPARLRRKRSRPLSNSQPPGITRSRGSPVATLRANSVSATGVAAPREKR